MASQVTNYQCPGCTGPLHFVGASGKLECDYCGSTYDVAEIEALYADKNEKAAAAQQTAETKAAESGWDTSGMSTDWGADGEGMKAYSCPSCGAELICDASTAATSCPYWRQSHGGAGAVLRRAEAGIHHPVQAQQG